MSEVKQVNFRINTETADAFRKFCEENGLNQAQGFDHIMQVLELDRAKAVTPGRITEIENFEKSVKNIMSAYLYSLEINNTAEERIQEQFKSSLESKDKAIADLQMKSEELRLSKEYTESRYREATATAEQAQKDAKASKEQAETASKLAAEKDKTVATLADKLAISEEKAAGYDNLLAEKTSLETTLAKVTSEYEAKVADLEIKMERSLSDAKKDAALAMANAVMEKEREMQDAMRKIEMENAKLSAILEHVKAENDRLLAELAMVKETAKEEKAKK